MACTIDRKNKVGIVGFNMVNGFHGLGKDTELRSALTQQQSVLDQLKAQQAANEQGFKLSKHDAMKIALGIMLLMFLFK